MKGRKVLFFDIQISGHHSEYISHLVDYLIQLKDENQYYFVVHPDFSQHFPCIYSKGEKIEKINWIEIIPKEYEKSQRGGMIKKSLTMYKIMNYYAQKCKVDHVCLLYFNIFQLSCAFYRPSYTLSGILFLQFYRMSKNSWKEKFHYYRKYLITWLYTFNPRIKRIFILNDQKAVSYFNKEFKSSIYKMLPDPIPELKPLRNFDIYTHYQIGKGCKIFLHLGGLGYRKGTFEIIDAARYIPKEKQSKIAILLVGEAENGTAELIIKRKMEQSKKESKVQIIWDNQFVPNEMMKSLFEQCFIILIPYKNPEGSSGILGHAGKSNKPIIGPDKGLLGELIKEYNLGVVIKETNYINISIAMDNSLSQKFFFDYRNSEFVQCHQPFQFSKELLEV